MSYPQSIDYNETLQDAKTAFSDAELQRGQVALTPLGLPLALSGGFALTYTISTGARKYAVRCFHREVPEAEKRYAAIAAKLDQMGSPNFVNFAFQPQGVRVRGKRYPIVKMDWVEGHTLGVYLDRHAANRTAMGQLRQKFLNLAALLQTNGIAHGDLQNENIIIQNDALRLIDYDGMFVPGMMAGHGSEVGHKHFQHPHRTTHEFGPTIDRFSFIVIDLSLQALQEDPSLHGKYREGGQAIILKANDFADPSSSLVFRELSKLPVICDHAANLTAICKAPLSKVPSLSDFLAGRNIPASSKIIVPSTPASGPSSYISAFSVLDASDFNSVLRRVGDKAELIGKIVSVRSGIGKRGRGKGKEYVFINFGAWNKESVKITVWSDVLVSMKGNRPNESWQGRWISVTGLIDPPYDGQHYGRPYRNVGIALASASQIVQLSAQEATFRLGRSSGQLPANHSAASRGISPQPTRTSNDDVLRTLRGTTNRGSQATRTPAPSSAAMGRSFSSAPSRPMTSNKQILAGLSAQGLASPSPAPVAGRSTFTSSQRSSINQPIAKGWGSPIAWIIGLFVLFAILRIIVR